MSVPGSDPKFPAYAWGDGTSPLARGVDAFEIPPVEEVAIDMGAAGDYSRRERRANRQESGFAIDNWDAHDPTSTAAVESLPTIPSI